ncbi:MAG: hypothetical protein HRT36_08635 [Alphaproteobacteria bacterium]|nr:hypothetical protein [Alphaproteobacteria bacterium]
MLYLGFGLLLLIVLIGVKLWLAETDPKKLWQQMQFGALLFGIALFFFLLVTGRLAWIWAAFLAMIPWLSRLGFIAKILGLLQRHGWTSGQKKQQSSAFHEVMTRRRASEILNISEHASEAKVRAAHKELMKRNHPDHGGSDYLAKMLNQARDTLLQK